MSDPDPPVPPPPPTMTMVCPVAVTNVGTADVVVVDAAGADMTLKPGQTVNGTVPPPPEDTK